MLRHEEMIAAVRAGKKCVRRCKAGTPQVAWISPDKLSVLTNPGSDSDDNGNWDYLKTIHDDWEVVPQTVSAQVAFEALNEGKKVRRQGWYNNTHISLRCDGMCLFHGDTEPECGFTWKPSADALIATDWIILDP